jgi:hypothetical protein
MAPKVKAKAAAKAKVAAIPKAKKGGQREGAGNAKLFKDMLAAIKSGSRFKELARDFPARIHGHHVHWCWTKILECNRKPTKARHTHKECCKQLGMKTIPFDGASWQQSAIVIGSTGIGKTQWALSHFNEGKGALLVSEIDDLLAYSEEDFDGIVFDDMQFNDLSVNKQKHLLDWDQERLIRCSTGADAMIPAKTKKIFTCTWGGWPFSHGYDAIDELIYTIETDKNKGSKREREPPLEEYEDTLVCP